MLSSAPLQLLERRWIKNSPDQNPVTFSNKVTNKVTTTVYYFQLLCVGQLQFFALIAVYLSRVFLCRCTIAQGIKRNYLFVSRGWSQWTSKLSALHLKKCTTLQKCSVNLVKEPLQVQQQSFSPDILASSPVLSFHGFGLQLNSAPELHTRVVQWTRHWEENVSAISAFRVYSLCAAVFLTPSSFFLRCGLRVSFFL